MVSEVGRTEGDKGIYCVLVEVYLGREMFCKTKFFGSYKLISLYDGSVLFVCMGGLAFRTLVIFLYVFFGEEIVFVFCNEQFRGFLFGEIFLLFLKLLQRCFFLQSEISFNLILEKCDIFLIFRDYFENRIYQRKIQVRSGRGERIFDQIGWSWEQRRRSYLENKERFRVWSRFLGKWKSFLDVLMLGICFSEKFFSCKKKNGNFV